MSPRKVLRIVMLALAGVCVVAAAISNPADAAVRPASDRGATEQRHAAPPPDRLGE